MSKMTDFSRTIVAPATSLGSGSIAIIRVSGVQSWPIVSKIFHGTDINQATPNTIHFGRIFEDSREIDQVVIMLYRAPHSYTGEDTVEISCHANPLIVNEIISLLIRNGADSARAGEFTLRAYLNNKIDLSQAEAVSAIIQAKSKSGVHNSLNHLEGALTSKIRQTKNNILELTAELETDLDFSEENISIASPREIKNKIDKMRSDLISLAGSYNLGRIFDSGITLAIVGEPNVGKSTLMNALLGQNRVITSAIPGTTRDMIKENLIIDHIFITLTDTAGLREIQDEVEHEGIRRTEQMIQNADLIIYVLDLSKEMNLTSQERMNQILNLYRDKMIIAGNKSDLKILSSPERIAEKSGKKIIKISAKDLSGIDRLRGEIREFVQQKFELFGEDIVVSSVRQRDALLRSAEALFRAGQGMENNHGFEFTVVDLRLALDALGEITGETVTDDILNYIFSKFCIGK